LSKITIAKRFIADDKLLIALLAPFYSAIINSAIVFMLQIETSHPGFVLFRNASIVIIGLIFLYALPAVLERAAVFTGVVVSLLIILLAVTLLIFPDNILFLYKEGVLIYTLSVTLPCFIYAYCVKDLEKFYNYLRAYAAVVIAVCCFILGSMFLFSFGINNSYSMSLGYSAIMASIIYLHKYIEKKNVTAIIAFIIGLFIIITIGSRGPLLCLAIFLLLLLVHRIIKGKKTVGSVIYFAVLLVIFALMIIALNNQEWLIKLSYFLSDLNINSRTLNLYLNESLTQSSSRNDISSFFIQKIKEQPLMGYGIGGDRVMLGVGMYAHNLFLALFVFFGVIGGALSSLIIVSVLVWALVTVKNQEEIALLLIFFSVYFVSSMVSGDILTNYGFWILMGLSIRVVFSGIRLKKGPESI